MELDGDLRRGIELGQVGTTRTIGADGISNSAAQTIAQRNASIRQLPPSHVSFEMEEPTSGHTRIATGNPIYPVPIPSDKMDRAVELYSRYLLEVELARKPPVVTSHTNYGGGGSEGIISLDRESVLLTAYDGTQVKPRERRRLSPESRAKAALIRYIGACPVCRAKQLRCPVEHHDVARLQEALQAEKRRDDKAATSAIDRTNPDEPAHGPSNIERPDLPSLPAAAEAFLSPTANASATIGTHHLPNAPNSLEPPKCNLCTIFLLTWFFIAAGSVVVGLWRSIVTADEGKGFTDAAYIVAVGGLILFPLQNQHSKKCKVATQ